MVEFPTDLMRMPGPVQLGFTGGGIKPISEGHSLISLCWGSIQIFERRGPIQIAENRRKSRRLRWLWLFGRARAAMVAKVGGVFGL